MVSLEDALRDIDLYLGQQPHPEDDIIEFRDAIHAVKTGKEDASLSFLRQFLDIKETDDWQEAAACFSLSTSQHILLREAGRGGFGVVYKAFDTLEDDYRAIKFLTRNKTGKPADAYTIFGHDGLEQNERTANKFRHENIVKYHGIRADGALIFEWIDGVSLDKIKLFSPKESKEIIRQVCHALGHMHNTGYAYNDLRFPNVMRTQVMKRGKQNTRITLLDYSIATELNEIGISIHKGNLSSREIAAPESVLRQELSVRTDIWALGHLMYKLYTGEHAFPHIDKDALAEIICDPQSYTALKARISADGRIPEKEKAMIIKCLSYNPKDRYQSVSEFLSVFDPPETIWSRISLGIGALGVAAAGLGCLGVVCAGVLYSERPDPEIIKTEPTVVEVLYSRERKQQRSPRIKTGETPEALCNNPQSEGYRADRFDKPNEYTFCLEWRSAEAMLDRADFVVAVNLLENLRKKYPNQYEPLAGLLEAYYELGLLRDAKRIKEELIKRFPRANPWELSSYGGPITDELLTYSTSLQFSRERCGLAVVTSSYPECDAVVALSTLSSDKQKEEYLRLQQKFPRSFVIPREYARFLLDQLPQTEKNPLEVRETLYSDLSLYVERVNQALAAYQRAAKNAEEKGPFLYEISTQFRERFSSIAHAFVFSYRAEEATRKETGRNPISPDSRKYFLLLQGESEFSRIPERAEVDALYAQRSRACTKNKEFFIVDCSL